MFENVKGSGNLKFVLVMLICTLVASLVVSLVVTPASLPTGGDSFTIVANVDRPQPYSFLIGALSNGSYYCLNGSDNQYVSSWTSTNAVLVMQNAQDSLTTGGHIVLKNGLYVMRDTLNLTSNDVWFQGSTLWVGNDVPASGENNGLVMAKSINKDMIYVTGQKVVLSDLFLDGNNTGNTLGNGIKTGTGGYQDFRLQRVYVFNSPEKGVVWQSANGGIEDLYVEYSKDYGLYVTGNAGIHNTFNRVEVWSPTNQGIVEGDGAGFNRFLNCYVYGSGKAAFYLYGTKGSMLSSCAVYSSSREGIWFYGGQQYVVSGMYIYNAGVGADNTYDAVMFSTLGGVPASNNTLVGINIFSGSANKFRYGINEADYLIDFNIFMGNHVTEFGTAAFNVTGVNTLYSGFNIGS